MSKRKIKATKTNRSKPKFHTVNVPLELWPSYVDFMWGSVLNVTPGTLNKTCIEFVKHEVMKAIDSGSVKIENNKIKVD